MTRPKSKINLVRSRPHELASIIKSLAKQSEKAILTLSELCSSKDAKIALEAAKALLNSIKEMSTSAHRDELQLILVKSKIGQATKAPVADDTPFIDFNNIQDI